MKRAIWKLRGWGSTRGVLSRASGPVLESLESRRLLAVTVANLDGVLTIVSDDAPDSILVQRSDDETEVVVSANGAEIGRFASEVIGRVSVEGGGGDDVIDVRTGVRAVINGGDGNDFISSGPGDDQIFGGDGNDTILGNGGRDYIDGGDGNDLLSGGNGPDVVIGGLGDDEVYGGGGADRVFGDRIEDIDGQFGGNDTLGGGAGSDTLYGGGGADLISGGSGVDLANYSARTSDLVLTIGTPSASGASGEGDTIASDVEKLNGGSGNDSITGSAGNNTLWGGPGNDTINGLGGDDLIFGFTGDDVLNGGEGDDYFFQGSEPDGADDIDGGPGRDTVDYSQRTTGVFIGVGNVADDGQPDFSVDPTDPAFRTGPGAERDNVRTTIEVILGGAGDDTIDASTVAPIPGYAVSLNGGLGNDTLFGTDFGNDTIVGGRGQDTINGFAGDDQIFARDGELDLIDGGPGNDYAQVDDDEEGITNVEVIDSPSNPATNPFV